MVVQYTLFFLNLKAYRKTMVEPILPENPENQYLCHIYLEIKVFDRTYKVLHL